MNLELKSLEIKNFRSIKELKIDFDKVTKIEGRNGSGKSTIYQAWTWLIVDKIFVGNSELKQFEIKPIFQTNVEVATKAIIEIDGDEVILEKVFREKWTKQRGNIEPTFSGHETKYLINNVDMRKKDYDAFIEAYMDINSFKLLTNPVMFDSLKWDEKRKIIIQEKYSKNLNEIQGKIQSQKKSSTKINKKLDELVIKIDTLNGQKEEVEYDETAYKEVINKISVKQAEKDNLENSVAVQKKDILKDISKMELLKLEFGPEIANLRQKIANNEKNKEIIEDQKKELKYIDERLKSVEATLKDERSNYDLLVAETFAIEEYDKNCKACGQVLPENLSQIKIKKLKENWEKEQKNKIDLVKNKGRHLKLEIKKLQENRSKISEKEIVYLSPKKWENEIDKKTEELKEIEKYIDDNKNQLAEIKPKGIEEIEKELVDLNSEKDKYISLQAKKEQQIKLESTIEGLIQERKEAVEKYKEVNQNIVNLEEELKKYVEEATKETLKGFSNRINFKLFETQINGGIKETFDILYDGVSWDAPLNNGFKILAGIEIIKAINRQKNIQLPVFIDNAESLTSEVKYNGQLIMLSCSESELKTL